MGGRSHLSFQTIYEKHASKISIAIPLMIEVIQPEVRRSFYINDVILNRSGIVIAFLIATAVKENTQRISSPVETIGLRPAVAAPLYLYWLATEGRRQRASPPVPTLRERGIISS